MRPIKIAHCMSALSGGVGTVIFSYFDHFNPKDYEVHVITQDIVSTEYEALYKQRNYTIHVVPPKREGIIKNICAIKKIIDKERFDIVHSHMTVTNFFPLFAATLSGVKVKINHSHLAGNLSFTEKNLISLSKLFSTDLFACGHDAGEVAFGKSNYTILHNAIALNVFAYDSSERKKQRKLMEYDEKDIVFCNVGRFVPQKNHNLLLHIFEKIWKRNQNARLMLIGEGELLDLIKDEVSQLEYRNRVTFLGMVTDVNKRLQAADAFILPSRNEGLCVAAIEAQAAGLPCIMTGRIDRTTKVNENVTFVASDDADEWADICLEYAKKGRLEDTKRLELSGFDINKEAKKLDDYYKKSVNL